MLALANETRISIAAGIVVGLLASCVQSLGLTIQRKSHVLNQALPGDRQRVEHRRPLWLLGFAIFFFSNILGSIFQIASLPVVILAPLGAVSLLWNAFFARLLLGDVFSPWMILGTLLIAGGAVLIAVFGIVPEPTHSLEDLLVLFGRPTFVAYFSLLAFTVVVCLAITHISEFSYNRRLRRASSSSPPMSPVLVATESSTDLTTERTPLLDRKPRVASSASSINSSTRATVRPTRTALYLALSYASFSGTLSGMCLIFAKSGVELLLLTVGGKNQFWRWESWLLLFGLVVFALLQLWYLHKALILADPTIVCPLAFCFYNLSSIVNGLVYFDQLSALPSWHIWLVVLGIAVLLGGVWVVSFQAVDVGTWTDEEDDDEVSLEDGEVVVEPTGIPGIIEHSAAHSAAPIEEHDIAHRHSRESLTPSTPPPAGDRTSSATVLSPGGSRRVRRRPTLSPEQTLSPPPAPGFSIGLSPVSPGFALVPRERRRRISGDESAWHGVVRHAQMRRAVSEGAVASEQGADGVHADVERGEGARRSVLRSQVKARWKWLRGVVTGR
ncbi:hypothetical protein FA95DRAFT_1553198 [Auriscalpium vulgare]|uniref:Uncharacterized protein n=1 Tax=Auriscalpium vulgare TaxID=40419 RepID=A0ACB8S9T1_9AGAM|nr:hypothetical protein FA95DRAFT_1553198 [Auriscalpium vulgare]